jgi:hypothetical protein
MRYVARIPYLEYHVTQVDLIWDPCGVTHDRMRDRLKCDPPIGRNLPNLRAVRSVVGPRSSGVNIGQLVYHDDYRPSITYQP